MFSFVFCYKIILRKLCKMQKRNFVKWRLNSGDFDLSIRSSLFLGSRSPVRASRVSDTPFPGGSPFFCTLCLVQPSPRSNTPLPGGGFRRLRAAGTVSKRIDTPYGGFYPLGTPSSALLGIPRRTERLRRSYLCSGPKKGTAVPLPIHRPQSAIPFTATLKPLELCYIQLRKTRAICRDNAATARKT